MNTMLCWNPGTAEIALVPYPDKTGACLRYECSVGLGCDPGLTFEQRKTVAFVEAVHLIVGDGCDAQAVHRALLGLEEYRDGCAADMPGL